MNDLPDLRVRRYVSEDLDELEKMDAACFPPRIAFSGAELRLFIGQKHSLTLIAECGGEIAGFAIGRMGSRLTGHVITLDVAPSRRRLGIGRRLMEALHGELRSRGARSVVLEVDASNDAARRFYESLGYDYGERLKRYYPGGRDALRMVRALESE